MNIAFFYISVVAVWAAFLVCIYLKPLKFENVMIGIAAAAFSLVLDATMGEHFGLYHYVNLQVSPVFMVGSAVFLYSIIGIIYTQFMPIEFSRLLIYMSLWIIGMLAFEYLSVYTKTIVFTGWKPIPWSIILYIFSFTWISTFFNYISKVIIKSN